MGDDPNRQGASRRWIITAVESSLRRLQTDHIDLYQVHRLDPDTDIEETLSGLSDLVHSGKVRAIGSSTTPASDIIEAQWVAERRGLERFRTEQPPYSILNRAIEGDVLPVTQRYGMGTLVWGPLGQGLLTGRVRKGQQTDLRRTRFFKALSDERRLDAVEQLIPLAQEAGLPMTHLAMAFAIAHPGVTSALLGRAPWSNSTTCSPAWTSRSPTRSSTGSMRSCRPAPTSARSTRPTYPQPSSARTFAADPSGKRAAV